MEVEEDPCGQVSIPFSLDEKSISRRWDCGKVRRVLTSTGEEDEEAAGSLPFASPRRFGTADGQTSAIISSNPSSSAESEGRRSKASKDACAKEGVVCGTDAIKACREVKGKGRSRKVSLGAARYTRIHGSGCDQ